MKVHRFEKARLAITRGWRPNHLRKFMVERVCVCHHNIISWNKPSLVFMDTCTVKKMARLISKGIMHSTELTS